MHIRPIRATKYITARILPPFYCSMHNIPLSRSTDVFKAEKTPITITDFVIHKRLTSKLFLNGLYPKGSSYA